MYILTLIEAIYSHIVNPQARLTIFIFLLSKKEEMPQFEVGMGEGGGGDGPLSHKEYKLYEDCGRI